ncbi:MAG: anti-sigma factor, partial [Chloroflexi bacterium]|nr:anti-sigma factor [Chloroflexota bacterium]
EFLPTPPSGKTYQAWARHGDTWTSLGTFTTNGDGAAQLVAEDPALSTPPDAVLITLEPSGGSHAPTGQPVLAWSNT